MPDAGGKNPAHASSPQRWSWLMTVLKIGLSVLAFAVVALSVDLSAAWERAANQSLPFVILSASILSVQLLLVACAGTQFSQGLVQIPRCGSRFASTTYPRSSMRISGEQSVAMCCEPG